MNNNDVEEEIEKYLKKNNIILDAKKSFFINKIIEDIRETISIIQKQKFYIGMDQEIYEKRIEILFNKKVPIKFMGIVDKIFYKKVNDKYYVSVIDYKTGNVDIDLNPVYYGFNLQLPIYIYLIKNAGEFTNPKFAGFYIQHVLNNIPVLEGPSYSDSKEKALKLNGYSNSDISCLEMFDTSYQASEIIKGMKVKNDGNLSAYAKILSDEEINRLINHLDFLINKNIDEILNGNFAINPKILNGKDMSCDYCPFEDICYKKNKDYVYLKSDDLIFLRDGDIYD